MVDAEALKKEIDTSENEKIELQEMEEFLKSEENIKKLGETMKSSTNTELLQEMEDTLKILFENILKTDEVTDNQAQILNYFLNNFGEKYPEIKNQLGGFCEKIIRKHNVNEISLSQFKILSIYIQNCKSDTKNEKIYKKIGLFIKKLHDNYDKEVKKYNNGKGEKPNGPVAQFFEETRQEQLDIINRLAEEWKTEMEGKLNPFIQQQKEEEERHDKLMNKRENDKREIEPLLQKEGELSAEDKEKLSYFKNYYYKEGHITYNNYEINEEINNKLTNELGGEGLTFGIVGYDKIANKIDKRLNSGIFNSIENTINKGELPKDIPGLKSIDNWITKFGKNNTEKSEKLKQIIKKEINNITSKTFKNEDKDSLTPQQIGIFQLWANIQYGENLEINGIKSSLTKNENISDGEITTLYIYRQRLKTRESKEYKQIEKIPNINALLSLIKNTKERNALFREFLTDIFLPIKNDKYGPIIENSIQAAYKKADSASPFEKILNWMIIKKINTERGILEEEAPKSWNKKGEHKTRGEILTDAITTGKKGLQEIKIKADETEKQRLKEIEQQKKIELANTTVKRIETITKELQKMLEKKDRDSNRKNTAKNKFNTIFKLAYSENLPDIPELKSKGYDKKAIQKNCIGILHNYFTDSEILSNFGGTIYNEYRAIYKENLKLYYKENRKIDFLCRLEYDDSENKIRGMKINLNGRYQDINHCRNEIEREMKHQQSRLDRGDYYDFKGYKVDTRPRTEKNKTLLVALQVLSHKNGIFIEFPGEISETNVNGVKHERTEREFFEWKDINGDEFTEVMALLNEARQGKIKLFYDKTAGKPLSRRNFAIITQTPGGGYKLDYKRNPTKKPTYYDSNYIKGIREARDGAISSLIGSEEFSVNMKKLEDFGNDFKKIGEGRNAMDKKKLTADLRKQTISIAKQMREKRNKLKSSGLVFRLEQQIKQFEKARNKGGQSTIDIKIRDARRNLEELKHLLESKDIEDNLNDLCDESKFYENDDRCKRAVHRINENLYAFLIGIASAVIAMISFAPTGGTSIALPLSLLASAGAATAGGMVGGWIGTKMDNIRLSKNKTLDLGTDGGTIDIHHSAKGYGSLDYLLKGVSEITNGKLRKGTEDFLNFITAASVEWTCGTITTAAFMGAGVVLGRGFSMLANKYPKSIIVRTCQNIPFSKLKQPEDPIAQDLCNGIGRNLRNTNKFNDFLRKTTIEVGDETIEEGEEQALEAVNPSFGLAITLWHSLSRTGNTNVYKNNKVCVDSISRGHNGFNDRIHLRLSYDANNNQSFENLSSHLDNLGYTFDEETKTFIQMNEANNQFMNVIELVPSTQEFEKRNAVSGLSSYGIQMDHNTGNIYYNNSNSIEELRDNYARTGEGIVTIDSETGTITINTKNQTLQIEKSPTLLEQEKLESMHEKRRETRLREDGTYKQQIETTEDESRIQEHNGETKVDIANTKFNDLPLDLRLKVIALGYTTEAAKLTETTEVQPTSTDITEGENLTDEQIKKLKELGIIEESENIDTIKNIKLNKQQFDNIIKMAEEAGITISIENINELKDIKLTSEQIGNLSLITMIAGYKITSKEDINIIKNRNGAETSYFTDLRINRNTRAMNHTEQGNRREQPLNIKEYNNLITDNKEILEIDNTNNNEGYNYANEEMKAEYKHKKGTIIEKIQQHIEKVIKEKRNISEAEIIKMIRPELVTLKEYHRIEYLAKIKQITKKFNTIHKYLDFENGPYKTPKELLCAMRGITDPKITARITNDILVKQQGLQIIFYVKHRESFEIIATKSLKKPTKKLGKGLNNPQTEIPDLGGTLTVITRADESIPHEGQHNRNTYFMPDKYESKIARSKDEITAFLKDGHKIEEIEKFLTQPESEGGLYQYGLKGEERERHKKEVRKLLGYAKDLMQLTNDPKTGLTKNVVINILSNTQVDYRESLHSLIMDAVKLDNQQTPPPEQVKSLRQRFVSKIRERAENHKFIKDLANRRNSTFPKCEINLSNGEELRRTGTTTQTDVINEITQLNTKEENSIEDIKYILNDPKHSHIGRGPDNKGGIEISAIIDKVIAGKAPITDIPEEIRPYVENMTNGDKLERHEHKKRRKSRLNSDGTYIPLILRTTDQARINQHKGETRVDIANTEYENLPSDLQSIITQSTSGEYFNGKSKEFNVTELQARLNSKMMDEFLTEINIEGLTKEQITEKLEELKKEIERQYKEATGENLNLTEEQLLSILDAHEKKGKLGELTIGQLKRKVTILNKAIDSNIQRFLLEAGFCGKMDSEQTNDSEDINETAFKNNLAQFIINELEETGEITSTQTELIEKIINENDDITTIKNKLKTIIDSEKFNKLYKKYKELYKSAKETIYLDEYPELNELLLNNFLEKPGDIEEKIQMFPKMKSKFEEFITKNLTTLNKYYNIDRKDLDKVFLLLIEKEERWEPVLKCLKEFGYINSTNDIFKLAKIITEDYYYKGIEELKININTFSESGYINSIDDIIKLRDIFIYNMGIDDVKDKLNTLKELGYIKTIDDIAKLSKILQYPSNNEIKTVVTKLKELGYINSTDDLAKLTEIIIFNHDIDIIKRVKELGYINSSDDLVKLWRISKGNLDTTIIKKIEILNTLGISNLSIYDIQLIPFRNVDNFITFFKKYPEINASELKEFHYLFDSYNFHKIFNYFGEISLSELGKYKGIITLNYDLPINLNFEEENHKLYIKFIDRICRTKYNNENKGKIIEKICTLPNNKAEAYINIIEQLDNSISTDIQRIKNELMDELLESDNPEKDAEIIINIFEKNYLPLTGKIYKVFEILYPQKKFAKTLQEYGSPVLHQYLQEGKDVYGLIYRDLMNIAIKSGDPSLREYLEVFKGSEAILKKFENLTQEQGFDPENEHCLNGLSQNEKEQILHLFKKISILYSRYSGKKLNEGNLNISDTQLVKFYNEIKKGFNLRDGKSIYDRLQTLLYINGLKYHSVEEVLQEMELSKKQAHERGLKLVNESEGGKITFPEHAFLKGVRKNAFSQIIKRGITSREYLGGGESGKDAQSDGTPFDIDGWFINSYMDNSMYGNINLVINTDKECIYNSRKEGTEQDSRGKYELFETGGKYHYGIRTGIPMTEVDYIIYTGALRGKEFQNICYEIAKNGYYIPITDAEGNIKFTPEMYHKIRQGFNYMDEYGFDITENNGIYTTKEQDIQINKGKENSNINGESNQSEHNNTNYFDGKTPKIFKGETWNVESNSKFSDRILSEIDEENKSAKIEELRKEINEQYEESTGEKLELSDEQLLSILDAHEQDGILGELTLGQLKEKVKELNKSITDPKIRRFLLEAGFCGKNRKTLQQNGNEGDREISDNGTPTNNNTFNNGTEESQNNENEGLITNEENNTSNITNNPDYTENVNKLEESVEKNAAQMKLDTMCYEKISLENSGLTEEQINELFENFEKIKEISGIENLSLTRLKEFTRLSKKEFEIGKYLKILRGFDWKFFKETNKEEITNIINTLNNNEIRENLEQITGQNKWSISELQLLIKIKDLNNLLETINNQKTKQMLEELNLGEISVYDLRTLSEIKDLNNLLETINNQKTKQILEELNLGEISIDDLKTLSEIKDLNNLLETINNPETKQLLKELKIGKLTITDLRTLSEIKDLKNKLDNIVKNIDKIKRLTRINKFYIDEIDYYNIITKITADELSKIRSITGQNPLEIIRDFSNNEILGNDNKRIRANYTKIEIINNNIFKMIRDDGIDYIIKNEYGDITLQDIGDKTFIFHSFMNNAHAAGRAFEDLADTIPEGYKISENLSLSGDSFQLFLSEFQRKLRTNYIVRATGKMIYLNSEGKNTPISKMIEEKCIKKDADIFEAATQTDAQVIADSLNELIKDRGQPLNVGETITELAEAKPVYCTETGHRRIEIPQIEMVKQHNNGVELAQQLNKCKTYEELENILLANLSTEYHFRDGTLTGKEILNRFTAYRKGRLQTAKDEDPRRFFPAEFIEPAKRRTKEGTPTWQNTRRKSNIHKLLDS